MQSSPHTEIIGKPTATHWEYLHADKPQQTAPSHAFEDRKTKPLCMWKQGKNYATCQASNCSISYVNAPNISWKDADWVHANKQTQELKRHFNLLPCISLHTVKSPADVKGVITGCMSTHWKTEHWAMHLRQMWSRFHVYNVETHC